MLADLPEAEPVAVREVRLEGPEGPVAVPYLLFRTRYGYHAAAGDWRRMTGAERAWLLAHEDLLNRAMARDVEAVDAETRGAAARGWIGAGRDLPGNGHLPEGVVGVSTEDPVGGGDEPEAGGVEPTAGGGREVPEAPGDVPESAPVSETRLIEERTPADLTASSLACAFYELTDRLDTRRPFQLIVHPYAVHLAQHFAYRLFGIFWRAHLEVVPDEDQLDEDAWVLESGGWRYHNPGA